ncbi:MAG: RluA family pseudouridine synthase [Bacteroidetes bacterium]|nr:RluA family pseudouridine synthase [Bacteroidota bacterium]
MANNTVNLDQEDLFEHHKITVDPGQEPVRIDKYLINRIENVSRNRIQNATKSDCILVNNQAVKSNYKVKPFDQISIVLPHPPRDKEVKAENLQLDIVYEDDHVLVVNKEAGMVVHPAYGNFTGTLVNGLIYHFGKSDTDIDPPFRAGLVHRIDKDTSGLLVIAKDDYSLTFLARQFFDHSVERSYSALVWGHVKDAEGTITKNILRDPKDRRRMITTTKAGSGKHAVTHYKVLEQFNYTSWIECKLETGRTHQIRTHLASIGHPIFNDEPYGGARIVSGPSFTKYKQYIDNCFKLIPRQALHAQSLGFIHPHSGKEMIFHSDLPDDFSSVLSKWRLYSQNKQEIEHWK